MVHIVISRVVTVAVISTKIAISRDLRDLQALLNLAKKLDFSELHIEGHDPHASQIVRFC